MAESGHIRCDECQRRLEEYALDELPDDVNGSITVHLSSGCLACNQRLREILGSLAVLPAGLALESPPARLERELMARIGCRQPAEEALSAESTPVAPSRPGRRKRYTGLVGSAVALAACLVGVAAWLGWQSFDGQQDPKGGTEIWADLQRRLDDAERTQRYSSVPGLQFVSLGERAARAPVYGHIVVDELAKQWHVYVFRLPPPPEGRTYRLWFVTGEGEFALAGSILPDSSGAAGLLVESVSDFGRVDAMAISDESQSELEGPKGTILYRADFPK